MIIRAWDHLGSSKIFGIIWLLFWDHLEPLWDNLVSFMEYPVIILGCAGGQFVCHSGIMNHHHQPSA
eukprot:7691574-Karenia_brevis.AAC.1